MGGGRGRVPGGRGLRVNEPRKRVRAALGGHKPLAMWF
jgi:hypothetical protein